MSNAANPVLVLFAHPALRNSRVNAQLADAIRDVDGVTLHDLYEVYPELDIDVEAEQRLLDEHQVIVLQHPFYWYSTPAVLKEWQDLVLQHGWAYGTGGDNLRGKTLLSAISTGGREEAYQAEGYNHFTMRQLLAPIEQTANLCGMAYLAPFVVHGTHLLEEADLKQHAADYRSLLEGLRDERVDLDAARRCQRLNADLTAITIDQQES